MLAGPGLLRDAAPSAGATGGAPLIAHVIYRFDVGGLENGLVNLINRIPPHRFRHAVISLTVCSDFRRRIERGDVPVFSLDKPPGNSPVTHFKLWRLLRTLRPDILHTRNLAALEGTVPAALAGVPVRIHGEHGFDVEDLDGSNARRQYVRRLFRPFVHQYIAVSRNLGAYLQEKVGVPAARVVQIYNGVDTDRFQPARGGRVPLPQEGFAGPGDFVIGTVGRMQEVKDQTTLARAFILLAKAMAHSERRPRLVMIGDGPLRERVRAMLAEAGLAQHAWLPGERDDVPRIMRGLDLFVLPSLAEGVSNTILEAMASGLPVLATAVGGNPELVDAGTTGTLVPPADPESMARAMHAYASDPASCGRQGLEARGTVERKFGMDAMVNAYMTVYDNMLAARGSTAPADWRTG
jgi:sugar transferase (PEP-CTERM/EpsH1 system associated)